MIGYRISRSALEKKIEANVPGWLARAKARTSGFVAAGAYQETSTIWSEVKPVYMELQGESKCIYCERKLESAAFGTVEQDVEHFRPKGNVRAWKSAAVAKVTPPKKGKGGYYKLPYHPFNYCASCKPCNSTLKSDCFPVAGAYDLAGGDPVSLLVEKPLLIYPLGDFDVDPEQLIGFNGTSPHAIPTSGWKRDRALITIEFFRLDDLSRKNLFRERAMVLIALFPQLEKGGATAKAIVKSFTSDKAAHASCARSFVALHTARPVEAKKVFDAAVTWLTTVS